MACEAEHSPLGMFECQLCALTAPYSYVGQRPPYTQSIVLLEESYVMKDPFTSDKDRFLILGSRCSLCGRLVCVGPVGMQSVLLQEVLPPLCPGERCCFPSGSSARFGEKEKPTQEAFQPARLSDVSAAGNRVRSSARPAPGSWLPLAGFCGLGQRWGRAGSCRAWRCFWATGGSVCSPRDLSDRARGPRREGAQTPVRQSCCQC